MNLIELRKSKGISPSFVYKKLGISPKHFNRIEHGQGYLTKERIKILAKIYGVTMAEIKDAGGVSNVRNSGDAGEGTKRSQKGQTEKETAASIMKPQ